MSIIKCTTKYKPQEIAKAIGSPEKTPLGQGKIRVLKKGETFSPTQEDAIPMGQSLKQQLREYVAGIRQGQLL